MIGIRVGLLRDVVLITLLLGGAVLVIGWQAARQAAAAFAGDLLGVVLDAEELALAGSSSPGAIALERIAAGRVAASGAAAAVEVVALSDDGTLMRTPAAGAPAALAAALAATRDTPGAAVRVVVGDAAWWAAHRRVPAAAGPPLTLVALVPERRLLAVLVDLQWWLVAAVAAVVALVVLRVLALSRRLSRPIEALVAESDRISRGDLAAGAPIESGVSEIQRLAEAHARMREGLRSLGRMEDALQLARRIQQNTLPRRIPYLPGFDIDAFSEPAEQTGGDTYDVIGYRVDAAGRTVALSVDRADRALVLLADATGHGAGAALSATQVRAMLRMAVRTGTALEQIVRHINEQLCDDLHGGRFITAWLGILDAASGTITSFSAGQAPLLHYHAGEARCERIGADTPPFGISRELSVPRLGPRVLRPGDVFAVLSDGILEAVDERGEAYGEARALEVIERYHAETAGLVVTRLRQALARFTTGVSPADDRTAVIVRREAS
ncbi:MAG: SpoIIE family protein phosphatase [Gammaproteobacteria bacterium]|nr:SpoIIE family protein phosphatase [Gammaproteobacteria bacterium]